MRYHVASTPSVCSADGALTGHDGVGPNAAGLSGSTVRQRHCGAEAWWTLA